MALRPSAPSASPWTAGRIVLVGALITIVAAGSVAAWPTVKILLEAWRESQQRQEMLNDPACNAPKDAVNAQAVFCDRTPPSHVPKPSEPQNGPDVSRLLE